MHHLTLDQNSIQSWLPKWSLRIRWPTSRLWVLVGLFFLIAIALRTLNAPFHTPVFSLQQGWHRYAYANYVTNDDSLCNSVMQFESLSRLKSKADRILLYPQDWSGIDIVHRSAELLKKLEEYDVKLVPITIQEFPDVDPTWSKGFTKLLAFNQTQYDRVLNLDSDATILQPMDELFRLPPSPIAMPRAYWLENELNAQVVLFEPSATEFNRVQRAYADRPSGKSEMDMLNSIYGKNALVIPHRPYALVTGEFKPHDNHINYLGTEETWDAEAIMRETKFVHFSDWPLPKPWSNIAKSQFDDVFPPCEDASRCQDRRIWIGLYKDFLERRQDICGHDFMPSTGIPDIDI